MKNLFSLILPICFSTSIHAQIIDPNQTVKRKATDRANTRIDQGIDKGLDKVEEGIGSIFKKKDKRKSEKDSNSENDQRDSENTVRNRSGVALSGDSVITDFSTYKKSDFIPGKEVLFFEDFTAGLAQWELNEWDHGDGIPPGIAVVNKTNDKWYKMPRKGNFVPVPVKDLPELFTLEYDMYADLDAMNEMEGGLKAIFVRSEPERKEFSYHFNEKPQIQLDVHPSLDLMYITATAEYGLDERNLFRKEYAKAWNKGQVRHISIWRNKSHIKLYIDEKKYLDLPNGLPREGKYNLLFSSNLWGDGLYFTNIRLASGGMEVSKEITGTGKFATSNIYFDLNSARIRPESWPTLKEVASAIKTSSSPILIIGHTDSDGSDESNLLLSKRRAESVKLALVNEFHIPESQLSSDGKGESVPLESNATASGRSKNRRVEFIKK